MHRSRPRLPALLLALGLVVAGSAQAAGGRIDDSIRRAYPEILERWANGEQAAAIEALVELETSLVRDRKLARDIDEVWRSKLGVIRDAIGRGGNEVLVPVMLLHHDASRRYREVGHVHLAMHSGVMSAELAQFYAEKSTEPHAPLVAADLLVSLAGFHQHGLMVRRAATLYQQALDLDGSNVAAHVGLASMYERRGELPPALEHYQRACRIAPTDAEPCLRSAMAAARAGEHDHALRSLDRLLGGDIEPWMRQLALQVKAALHSGDAALGVARDALDQFPDSSRQAIQMAYLLERRRQSRQALEVLQQIEAAAEPESERYRYTRWPQTALDASRERFRRAAAAGCPVLQSAVHAPAPATEEASGE